MKKFAIIVAGGKGARMGNKTPKQFLVLGKKPILMHTLEKFYRFDPLMKIILVLPADQAELWRNLCRSYQFTVPHLLTKGGTTRFFSVKNGLSMIDDDGIVFVHDGVRPLVSKQTIQNCLDGAIEFNCAIPVIQLTDSIRHFSDGGNKAVDRSEYRLVQTPQTFRVSMLKSAFEKIDGTNFTDDASVFEANGHDIKLVEGNSENLKITTPTDFKIAEIIIDQHN